MSQLDAIAEVLRAEGFPVVVADVEKAVATEARADFEEWFLAELEREASLGFIRGREQMMEVLLRWAQERGWKLRTSDLIELSRHVFDLASAISLDLAGLDVPVELADRLRRLHFKREEVIAFPEAAWRFGALRERVASMTRRPTVHRLLSIARQHPLAEAELQGAAWASLRAAEKLRPIFLRDGSVIAEAALDVEREGIRARVSGAMLQRTDPLTLARQLHQDRLVDGYRDYERVARTEIADAYAHGAFVHDVDVGRFQPETAVYRIPRLAACKVCLALYTNPDGSFRPYLVRDLLAETTPVIDVGVRTPRLVRATIGTAHPHDLCSPWMRAPASLGPSEAYVEARRGARV